MVRYILAVVCLVGCSETPPTIAEFCALPAGDSPVRGVPEAPVTIVGFSDFECPYCGRASETLAELLVVNSPDVRFVFKHLPLTTIHTRAMDAAVAAQCAHAQNLFWSMHDQIFAHQDRLSDSQLRDHANYAGVDLAVWQDCVENNPPRKGIEADMKLADAAAVSGTPTFFINGEPLEGAHPLSSFQAIIDVKKSEAEDSGLGAEAYYESLVAQPCE